MLTRQAPNAAGLVAAVVVAAVLVDRRRLTDLGLDLDRGWWRGLAGGTALGAGIALSTVAVGLAAGFYEFVGVRTGVGIGPWIPVAVGAVLFQLLFVVPEELFVRGYVITNVVEGLDGASWASRRTAAGVGIAVSSAFFYLTHAAAKGTAFGLMVAALSLLLGLGYVLSGDLSVPVGIHFGVNIGGVLAGTNPQRASLLELSAASTVQESIVLPVEAVVARMGAAVVAVAALCLWYRAADGGIRVTPAIARPLLRRDESRASADD
jgi:membrane protease YdiL (CAAX protease family)